MDEKIDTPSKAKADRELAIIATNGDVARISKYKSVSVCLSVCRQGFNSRKKETPAIRQNINISVHVKGVF